MAATTSVWWKQTKYIALAVVVAALTVLIWCLRGLFNPGENPKPTDGNYLPPVPKPLQDAADRAAEEALVVKAENKAATEEKKAQLETISKIQEGKDRRKALAEFLRST